MHITKKCRTGAQRLHAALVETDPASRDLILIRAPGVLRLPRLRLPAVAAPRPAHAGAPPARTGTPCWRRRAAASDKPASPA